MRFVRRVLTLAFTASVLIPAAAAQDQAHIHKRGDGVSTPVLVKEVKPDYTAEAKAAGIAGTVRVDAVVREDGAVGEVEITQSLDEVHGLDREAVKAVKQWRFRPGKKDGEPVPVLVEIELTFTLK